MRASFPLTFASFCVDVSGSVLIPVFMLQNRSVIRSKNQTMLRPSA
ncbi:MAG: hypothetical protein ACI90G_001897, partial [Urechidicola sp.]